MIRKAIVSSLLRVHARAARTPYYDIWDHGNCYMVRDWVWGGRSPERNTNNPNWKVEGFTAPKSSAFYRWLCRHIVARAHTILRSDQDRHLHDHPAWSISIVLAGGYWEITQPPLLAEVAKPLYRGTVETIEQGWICAPSADHEFLQVFAHMGIYWRGPGAIVFRRAGDFHRLVLPKGTAAKSIWIIGPKSQHWGFLVDGVKVPWREYLAARPKRRRDEVES
jgi:hypothetical protein